MVLRDQQSAPVTYDLRDDGDDVFGLGVGCNGLIRVFLQPLLAESAYEPYMSLSRLYKAHESTVTATVIASPASAPAPGSTFVLGQHGAFEPVGDVRFTDDQLRDAFLAELAEFSGARAGRFVTGDSGIDVLIAPLEPIPRLLVLGAGLDSVPVVRIAAELGWYVTVVDHRPAYLARGDLVVADAAELVDPRGLRRAIDLSLFDAAIVMSHHLETDAMYLQQLATAPLRYLGVLGPTARRQRLVKKLAESAPDLDARLRGPIGIDIGGGTPESIALSILAELQRVFSGQAQ
jgi:xanthine/CO dehydrogenase XdhC/CoxF family maturation factor